MHFNIFYCPIWRHIRLERDGAAFNGEGHCNAAEYNVNTE